MTAFSISHPNGPLAITAAVSQPRPLMLSAPVPAETLFIQQVLSFHASMVSQQQLGSISPRHATPLALSQPSLQCASLWYAAGPKPQMGTSGQIPVHLSLRNILQRFAAQKATLAATSWSRVALMVTPVSRRQVRVASPSSIHLPALSGMPCHHRATLLELRS